MNRRVFLGHVAGVTGAALTAHGVANTDVPPIRCAVLGINHAHALDLLKVLQESKDYAVAGVYEPESAVRAQFEKNPALQGIRWLSEKEALGDPRIEMVAIESDVPRLLDLAEAAVNADKHIHLDKPAGVSLPQFKRILDEAERRGRIVQMGYMFRYNPGFELLRRAVREGWLGNVFSVQASMCTDLTPEKRLQKNFHPGGMMLELGCHLIDQLVLLFGEPQKVSSFLRHDGPQADGLNDNTVAVLEYPGLMATVESSAQEPEAFPRRRFKVAGTKGVMVLEPLEPPALRAFFSEANPEFPKGESARSFPDTARHVADVADLARCIRGEAAFGYSKEHDYRTQRTVQRSCGEEV